MLFIVWCLLLIVAQAIYPVNTAENPTSKGNILFIGVVGSKSQKNFYNSVVETLANHGYHVTLLTPYGSSKPRVNITEVVFDENDISHTLPNIFKDGKMSAVNFLLKNAPDMCIRALQFPSIKEALRKHYDLAFVSMFFNECFLPFAYYKQIPFVLTSPAGFGLSLSGWRVGNPQLSSITPNLFAQLKNPMSFAQRILSALLDIPGYALYYYTTYSFDSKGHELELYPKDTPSIREIMTQASLMVANSFRLTEEPQPYLPNILTVGGLHCKPPQPLPQDLDKWVESSGEDGFIFFSLGSVARPSDIPERTIKLLLKVFGSLPQKVLMKYNLKDVPGGLPKNVRLTEWAPQQDLLGNPRIRLFITHGGALSTQEAAYHGVVVLGLPVFGDQDYNMWKVNQEGWGKFLDWRTLTEELLRDTILELIHDKSAWDTVKKLSTLIRDHPHDPAEELAWWTGYIIRTGGAKHLRSAAADLFSFQLYNVDVWITLALVGIGLLWLLIYVIWKLIRCCFYRREERKKPYKLKKQ